MRPDTHLEALASDARERPVHARDSRAKRAKLFDLNRELERELTRAFENRRAASQRSPMEAIAHAKAAQASYARAAELTQQMIAIQLTGAFYDTNPEPEERGVYDVARSRATQGEAV